MSVINWPFDLHSKAHAKEMEDMFDEAISEESRLSMLAVMADDIDFVKLVLFVQQYGYAHFMSADGEVEKLISNKSFRDNVLESPSRHEPTHAAKTDDELIREVAASIVEERAILSVAYIIDKYIKKQKET